MESNGVEFKLRCELRGHDEDVRALCPIDSSIVTASRDKTIKIWTESLPTRYDDVKSLVGHTDYVTAVASIPPGVSEDAPNGAIVSGSRDLTVALWDVDSCSQVKVLKGHQYQVTAVAVGPDGTVWSASLDGTVQGWRGGQSVATLKGHEKPVLALLVLQDGTVLSGSGDTTIKRWAGTDVVHTYTGHSDTVRVPGLEHTGAWVSGSQRGDVYNPSDVLWMWDRALALNLDGGFVSASHDLSLRVWKPDGSCSAELLGHSAIVFTAAVAPRTTAFPEGLIVSGADDNTMRLWRQSGECLQKIPHPGCVWSVAVLPNGDVVSACSDAAARVWTAAPERVAAEAVVTAYEANLAARQADQGSTPSGPALPKGMKMEDTSALAVPGRKDGDVKVVREGDAGIVFSWSAEAGEWQRLGEVVADPGEVSTASKMYRGQEWDYVWDVDVADGAPVLKMGMNRGESPYDVADRFLIQHDLPATYREQIVQWILKRTAEQGAAAAADLPLTGGGFDPFTGGRAVESAPRDTTPAAAAGSAAAFSLTGGGVDPFTGGRSAPALASSHLSRQGVLLFDTPPNADGVARKLRQLNAEVPPQVALNEAQSADGGPLDMLLRKLPAAASGTAGFSEAELGVLQRLLTWPAGSVFPALDVARMVALDEAGAAWLASGTAGMASGGGGVGGAMHAALAGGGGGPAAQQTGMWLASNCFRQPALRRWAVAQAEPLLDAAGACCTSPKKGVRLAAATLLLNLSTLAPSGEGLAFEQKAQAVSALVELVASTPADEADTVFRALQACGSLLISDPDAQETAVGLGLKEMLTMVEARASAPPRLHQVAAEVQQLVQHLL